MRTILFLTVAAFTACDLRVPENLHCPDLIAGDIAITGYTIGTQSIQLQLRNTTLFPVTEKEFFVAVTSSRGTAYKAFVDLEVPAPGGGTATTLQVSISTLENDILHWLSLGCDKTRIDSVPLLSIAPSRYKLATAHQTADINNFPMSWCPVGPGDVCLHDGTFNVCRTETGLRPLAPAQPGDLHIEAVMADPKEVADYDGEWIALHISRSVDLNGLYIKINNHAPGKIPAENNHCIAVTADSRIKLARKLDPAHNGQLTGVIAELPAMLPNRDEAQRLAILDHTGQTMTSVTFTPTKAGQICALR